jgi:LPS export ABC transporter protein LptC/lipopolysaccharide transport protein LptA
MSKWQRRARLVIALGAVALAIVVAFAFQRRVDVPPVPVTRADPKAVVETLSGQTIVVNKDKEDVRIAYDELRIYADGSATMFGVKVTTERGEGRTFTVSAKQAQVGKDRSNYIFEGDVHLTTSDGLALQTDRATYTEAEGVVRAAGPAKFSRGRMNGSGIGFSYDKNTDVLKILDDVVVDVAPGAPPESDAGGQSARSARLAMTITTGALELDRQAHVLRFDESLTATRGSETITADTGLGRLTEDDERLQGLELRGRSRIKAAPGGVGSLQSMSGRDIDLRYGADGETLEDALITGDGAIRVAGERGQASRQITADTIDISLAPDGSVPTALTAQGRVVLTLPQDKNTAARTISASSLDARGEAPAGLTSAVFTGGVRLRERGSDVNREATSDVLQVALKPGLSAIDEATFVRPVRFEDGTLIATAAQGRYLLSKGLLVLSGTAPSAPRPSVRNEQIAIDGVGIQVTLEGPLVHATGAVKSVLQPTKGPGGKDKKTPSMLKADQPVTVTADDLKYDGEADTATYTGNAQLWQAETTIKAAAIALDEKTGDLMATGDPVATTAVLMQTGKDGKKERTIANAKSKEFKYEEALRRATYRGDAFVTLSQGELRAGRIELYLKPSGDELERAEAFEGITLTEKGRKTTGDRLTYFSEKEEYVITGTPLKIVDECGNENTGRTLTYLKPADRIIIDGTPQNRTRGQSTKCS